MKVALYARVSKDEEKSDNRYQDPENQLSVLRKYCQFNEFEIVEEYIDRASGADPARPEFRKMLKEGWTKGFKAVIVWKFDRFTREPIRNALSYVQKLRDQKIGLISITESWLDTRETNPMADLVLSIMAWAGAEERRKISERTKAGIRQKRAIGQWKGGRPKGSLDKKPRKKGGYGNGPRKRS